MLAARQRARRARTRPRTDHTIETALAIVRDLAGFLPPSWQARLALRTCMTSRCSWPRCPGTKTAATVLRQFFRFARAQKIILPIPPAAYRHRAPRLHRQTITLTSSVPCSAATTSTGAPARGAAGILALLHGASSSESAVAGQ